MAMQLFERDQAAYNAAAAMLAETGKAAVIRPTGMGRSFIGFKLCENDPEKRVLWLAPSERRFRKHLADWRIAGGADMEHIAFLTYAELMRLSEEKIVKLKPDMAVLDGYRCAEAFGARQKIRRLQSMFPAMSVLGLSSVGAGGQQDAADELFADSIAFRMTLGEAIVCGVLEPPKYVLTSPVFWREDLETYKKRMRSLKSKAHSDTASACLETVYQAFEKTDGLDVVFDSYMEERHGKYIIFAPNYDVMKKDLNLAPDRFGKIDKDMHIYAVAPGDPSASSAFRDFCEDGSDHLRLLYCMDAPDEGVYTEDLSGVFLLCPVSSPAVYRQQIEWSLSAAGRHKLVVFDLAEHFGDLYRVDPIMEEMYKAVCSYRSSGTESLVVNDSFALIEEPAGCREMIEQLEDALAASWDIMYACAERYYQEHGDLLVSWDDRTDEGYSLWSWLAVQRRIRAGKTDGILNEEQIEKLDRIGMRWESTKDISWNKFYAAAKRYYYNTHNLTPLASYVTPDGVRLGAWLTQLRTARKIGVNSSYLTPEHIAQLDAIGMVWDVYDFVFERNYHSAVAYFREFGDLECPNDYADDQGIRLGAWLSYLRRHYKLHRCTVLTEEQFRLLDAIGMRWGSKHDVQWDAYYQCLVSYCTRTGNTDVPATWKEGSIPLGRWYRRQKELYAAGELRQDRTERLLSLGLNLVIEDPWEKKFQLAKAYCETHDGSLHVPDDYIVNGVCLSKWISEMQSLGEGRRKKKLTEEQRSKLESIGMVFGRSGPDLTWEQHYQAVKAYVERTGSLAIPDDLCDKKVNLKKWVNRQLGSMKKQTLDPEKQKRMLALGFIAEAADPFEEGFVHARAYYEQHGDLLVKAERGLCSDGYNLASWIRNLRGRKKQGKLSVEQIRRLETIGMVWNAKADAWGEMFEAAKDFAVPGETLVIPVHQQTANGKDLYEWYMRQRKLYAEGKLSADRQKKLLSIGAEMDQDPVSGHGNATVQPRDIQKVDRLYQGNAVNE